MIKDELLSLLFRDYTGDSPDNLDVLPKSGSDRIYCRMQKGDFTVLGVWNPNRKENDAFTGFAAHFASVGLNVPGVFKYLPEEMVYLTEDLGDIDLFSWVKKRMKTGSGTTEIEEIYRKVLKELIRFHFEAHKSLDYNLAYPRKKFDRSSVMWDLYYFKYMFLKLAGTGFNEQLLENDFLKLADKIVRVKADGFLYRDFQSRNIMIKDETPWFIDFQGGRKGAPHYDVASFLLDPYVELETALHDRLLDYYFSMLTTSDFGDRDKFISDYRIFGIVRLLQALGAYGFRGLYERKPGFTDSIPPAVRQLNRLFGLDELRKELPELARITDSIYRKWADSDKERRKKTTIIIESFSFLKGIPETFISEGGFMFDCRHLTDPYAVDELKKLNGKNKKVVEFFDGQKDIQEMIENAYHLISGSLESSGIDKAGAIRVCFGCVNGHHRSVYCSEKIYAMLKTNKGAEVVLFHNEIR
jgi:aminoglycoside/choline kinase family phosphotransferase